MRISILFAVCFVLTTISCKQRSEPDSSAKATPTSSDDSAERQKMEKQQKEFSETERQDIMKKFDSGAFSEQIAQIKDANSNGGTQYALEANAERSISLEDCYKIRDFGILVSFAQYRCGGELISIWGLGATLTWISGTKNGDGQLNRGVYCSYAGTYRGRYYGVKAGVAPGVGIKGGLFVGWNGICWVPSFHLGADIDLSHSTLYIGE